MNFLLGFIARNRLAVGLGVFLAVGLALYVAYSTIREAGRDDIRQEDAAAVGDAKLKGAEAREDAAGERASDDAATAAQHEERTDATKGLPDARPDDRTIRRRCVQLRQQGYDLSSVPECGGRPAGR